MKYNIVIGKGNWVESVCLGLLASVMALIIFPFAILLLGIIILLFPILGLLGLVKLERKS